MNRFESENINSEKVSVLIIDILRPFGRILASFYIVLNPLLSLVAGSDAVSKISEYFKKKCDFEVKTRNPEK